MEFPIYLSNYLYTTNYLNYNHIPKMALGKFPQNGDQLSIPRKPPFADSSSHYWENISSKVCIKWMAIWIIPKISSNSEKKNFQKKKNQMADKQEASKTKEYTISRRTDTCYLDSTSVLQTFFFFYKVSTSPYWAIGQ